MRLEAIHQRFGAAVDFVLVYVREAHPTDGWSMTINVAEAIEFAQPTNLDERVAVASVCAVELPFTMTTVIDQLDDGVAIGYAALPERLWLVDAEGRVAYRGGPGPWEFDPESWEVAIASVVSSG